MYSPDDIKLKVGLVYLSFKTTVDDIEQSESRKVDCELSA